jgi:hypothetical protein
LVPLLTFFWVAQVSAQSTVTGNYMLQSCESLMKGLARDQADAFRQGTCSGIADALRQTGTFIEAPFKWCTPDGVTTGQVIRVWVVYMQKHPELLHMHYSDLAFMALSEAWPCKK